MAVIPSAYNALMGMFSPRQPQNVSGSIYDMARADAQKQMLAQIGGGLMAASVPQTATMRAQALQGAFGNMGNIGTGVYNAAQARLMAQKAESQQNMMQQRDRMFAQENPPQGISPDQWSKLKVLYSYDPDSASSAFGKILTQGSDTSMELGSKTPIYVNYKDKKFPAYFLADGRVLGMGGEIIDTKDPSFSVPPPEEQAGLVAGAKVTGTQQAEKKAAAPAAIIAADKTINLIDSILGSPVLDSVIGSIQGRIDDPTIIGQYGGENAVATVNRINQLKAKGFISAINSTDIKGALSDAEGAKLDMAENALSRLMDEKSFRAELQGYRDIIMRAKQRQALIEGGKTEAEARALVPESPFIEQAPSVTAPQDLRSKYGLEQ